MARNMTIARKFPWKNYQTFVDVGGAQGGVPVQVALAHPHLSGGEFDLPPVGPIFEDYVKSFGLERRLTFTPGDFFKNALPSADVIIMGHILHDWNLEEKLMLLKKAYDALPKGGALIVHEAIIDDDRSKNAFGLLMSLNMLIETPGGFDYTGADCSAWMSDAVSQRRESSTSSDRIRWWSESRNRFASRPRWAFHDASALLRTRPGSTGVISARAGRRHAQGHHLRHSRRQNARARSLFAARRGHATARRLGAWRSLAFRDQGAAADGLRAERLRVGQSRLPAVSGRPLPGAGA